MIKKVQFIMSKVEDALQELKKRFNSELEWEEEEAKTEEVILEEVNNKIVEKLRLSILKLSKTFIKLNALRPRSKNFKK
uniref:Uncharacterized protein n=1 Tax=Lepeophtheirus salmonis TaxID=72036 RepID=A0A0K2UCV1_LEPSM